jgi:hypothetical protein
MCCAKQNTNIIEIQIQPYVISHIITLSDLILDCKPKAQTII